MSTDSLALRAQAMVEALPVCCIRCGCSDPEALALTTLNPDTPERAAWVCRDSNACAERQAARAQA